MSEVKRVMSLVSAEACSKTARARRQEEELDPGKPTRGRAFGHLFGMVSVPLARIGRVNEMKFIHTPPAAGPKIYHDVFTAAQLARL